MDESTYMPALCSSWVMGQGKECGKRGSAKYTRTINTFFTGAIAALNATGVMSKWRIDKLFFLAAIDRLDDFVWEQHAIYEAKQKAEAAEFEAIISVAKERDE